MSEQKYSEAGNPIYRHQDTGKKMPDLAGSGEHIEAITQHIEQHIGKVDHVFHELISDLVHIDVHFVKPSEKFPFNALITSGMSDKPMNVPEGLEDRKYAELCILLPPEWPLLEESFKDEKNYWPVRWLKILARLPHQYNTWLGNGHTIPNGENAEPFAENTGMGSVILFPTISIDGAFLQLKINEEKTIHFYFLYPLYKAEMDFKLKKGMDALIDRMDEFGVLSDVVNIKRENCCGRIDED